MQIRAQSAFRGEMHLLVFLLANPFWAAFAAQCGRPSNANGPVGRIVGGYDVGYYKYPWMATLVKDGEVCCGGSLVGPKTVVTAAHCYKPFFKLAK